MVSHYVKAILTLVALTLAYGFVVPTLVSGDTIGVIIGLAIALTTPIAVVYTWQHEFVNWIAGDEDNG